MKLLHSLFLATALCSPKVNAKIREYVETIDAENASHALQEQAEKVASLMEFTTPYYLLVPKKPGLQINPFNRMISHGRTVSPLNPTLAIPFIVINPAWFSSLKENQQTFLLARSFTSFDDSGALYSISKYFAYIQIIPNILLSLLVFLLIRFLLGRRYRWWLGLVLVWGILFVAQLLFITPGFIKLKTSIEEYRSAQVNLKALKKTLDKEAAVTALEAIDTFIKKELNEGELFWKPLENSFQKEAADLKN